MLKIKVHRGSHQIGGSIVELTAAETHVFVDFGMELSDAPEESTDGDMVAMIHDAPCDAVLFTHYHGDHAGLLKDIPRTAPDGTMIRLAMGATARQVLRNIHETLTGFDDADVEESRAILTVLNDEARWTDLEDGVPIVFGKAQNVRVTPIRVDHSAYDAYLFVIEAEGKVLVHTGDFRTHGRLGKGFFHKLRGKLDKLLGDRAVDVLVTEGTMLNRMGERILSEEKLEERARAYLARPENKYAFLLCSSTNVESLASFANAAMLEGRAFYVNSYVYEQIKLYRVTAGEENRALKFWKTYPFEPAGYVNDRLGMTQLEYMEQNGFLMLIGIRESYRKKIERFRKYDPALIYALWPGYVRDPEAPTYRKELGGLFQGWNKDRRIILHTSGHAIAKDLEQMILTVAPQEKILPIHTDRPDAFAQLDIGEYRERVVRITDGDEIEVA